MFEAIILGSLFGCATPVEGAHGQIVVSATGVADSEVGRHLAQTPVPYEYGVGAVELVGGGVESVSLYEGTSIVADVLDATDLASARVRDLPAEDFDHVRVRLDWVRGTVQGMVQDLDTLDPNDAVEAPIDLDLTLGSAGELSVFSEDLPLEIRSTVVPWVPSGVRGGCTTTLETGEAWVTCPLGATIRGDRSGDVDVAFVFQVGQTFQWLDAENDAGLFTNGKWDLYGGPTPSTEAIANFGASDFDVSTYVELP